MSEKEYILFCDESDRVGKYYSNAKEALYKTILGEIKKIHPRFNIGVSTGPREVSARWLICTATGALCQMRWNMRPN